MNMMIPAQHDRAKAWHDMCKLACMHALIARPLIVLASCTGPRRRHLPCMKEVKACVMSRVAALYLVERIKAEVVSMAATHFQALAVGQARQRALRRLARSPPGFSKSLTVRLRLPTCSGSHDSMLLEALDDDNCWFRRLRAWAHLYGNCHSSLQSHCVPFTCIDCAYGDEAAQACRKRRCGARWGTQTRRNRFWVMS